MKIALLSTFNIHMCCVGFLIHIFKDDEINVYFPDDRERYLEYYKSLYPTTKISLLNIKDYNKDDYNQSIKITANDPGISEEGIISTAHLQEQVKPEFKYITLTPWIKGENVKYIFPLYNGLNTVSYTKIIVHIGFFVPRYSDEDTVKFIRESDYNFVFVGGDSYNGLNNLPNVRIINKLNTFDLVKLIKQSMFIMLRKEPYQLTDRYSGAIGHAVSHKKPVIVQEYTADSYVLKGIVFKKEYCEVLDTLKNINKESYDLLVKEAEEVYDKIQENNKDVKNYFIN